MSENRPSSPAPEEFQIPAQPNPESVSPAKRRGLLARLGSLWEKDPEMPIRTDDSRSAEIDYQEYVEATSHEPNLQRASDILDREDSQRQ